MASVLALDIATRTGFAFWKPGELRPLSGVKQMPETGEDVGRMLDVYWGWLDCLLGKHWPDVVCLEAPIVGSDRVKVVNEKIVRTKRANIWTEVKLHSMCGVTEVLCLRAGAKYYRAHHSSVLAHFVGNGRLGRAKGKAAVLERCQRLGWEAIDDNAADALAVLDYSLHKLNIVVPWQRERLSPEIFDHAQVSATGSP